jgi:hypothetical protein
VYLSILLISFSAHFSSLQFSLAAVARVLQNVHDNFFLPSPPPPASQQIKFAFEKGKYSTTVLLSTNIKWQQLFIAAIVGVTKRE